MGKGFFTGIYGVNGPASIPGINLHASFEHAADAFNQVIAGKKIDGLALSGRRRGGRAGSARHVRGAEGGRPLLGP